ncbi:transcription antiterminator [Enterococcus cecorum]|uniref:BglG family transcription antiterminator n=4 Tax=Enterococcus cecorum TaxID=44008 RepID=UPI0022D371C0|nr:BglG family transcription antiterminator [Enterococcus cecorum]CAI3275534.1 transcription antiterminator [Enterococcus cecorum]CAI3289958.1 transcription antiterminator [Enterococcus cecorum]CAI3298562.1 transcription antiterminator [Enterococcus cecorum]CAI3298838.1 transcription antiterminator [Enterococcus cecorum]CAI3310482.1 transcription antiterminator [Enterococcus cecorum]
MNERIREIISILLKNPTIKSSELADKLSLTKRQVNYAITQFNQEMALNKLSGIVRKNDGTFFVPLEVVQTITENLISNELYSDQERVVIILYILTLNNEYTSVQHFLDYLEVSRSTFTEDIKRAQWLVEKYRLEIIYDRTNGYHIEGSEHYLLHLISDLVKQYHLMNQEIYESIFGKEVTFENIMHIIHSMEQMLHLSYSDESIEYLKIFLMILMIRANKSGKQENFFKGDLKTTPEYRMLSILLMEDNLEISNGYKEWMALAFLTSNIFEKKTTQEYDSDAELKGYIHEMVNSFEEQTLIIVDDRKSFEQRLLNHLRPACFRIKYDLSLGTYSFENLVKDSNHGILVELMKDLIIPIEDWLGKAFPNDELDLLSYYFGYQLISNNQMSNNQQPRAVIVCQNGVVVSKLMMENLKKLFPELHFIASLSKRDFYKYEEDYDLVFSTTPLNTDMNQYIVDPIMTYNQQIQLRYNVLNKLGLNKVDSDVDKLINTIRKYANIDDLSQLKDEIKMFLIQQDDQHSINEIDSLPSLTYYLKPSYIQVKDKCSTWEDAFRIACIPLLENRVVTEEFVKDCIKQASNPNYSSYLGNDSCIPHTSKENGILKDGISLLVLKQPIILPDGKRIKYIFPLSFSDLTKHLKAINQLADLCRDSKLLQDISESLSEKEIYQLIRKKYLRCVE